MDNTLCGPDKLTICMVTPSYLKTSPHPQVQAFERYHILSLFCCTGLKHITLIVTMDLKDCPSRHVLELLLAPLARPGADL